MLCFYSIFRGDPFVLHVPKYWSIGSTVVQLPFSLNVAVYVFIWLVCLAGLYFIWKRPKVLGFNVRWSTLDLLVVAIMAVLLEVYDNMIGDQFITPLIKLIPFGHDFALNDLPYMFLLMVGVAILRKPGAATAMVFLNYLLMQLMYGGSESVLSWPYGILQGLFLDLYILMRKGHVFSNKSKFVFWDGLFMGALRAVPAVTIQSAILGPLLSGQTKPLAAIFFYSLFNMIGNGLEAGITASLAIRVANSVNLNSGQTYNLDVESEGEPV
ncbi:MAG: hypothetical protein JWN30_2313 [Bacilli bacterium]|nr:hypothetical protein [Bacilli bacterium]